MHRYSTAFSDPKYMHRYIYIYIHPNICTVAYSSLLEWDLQPEREQKISPNDKKSQNADGLCIASNLLHLKKIKFFSHFLSSTNLQQNSRYDDVILTKNNCKKTTK